MRRDSRRPSLLTRAYAWLSRLYPASFRDEYQRELDAAFRHQLDEAGPGEPAVAAGAHDRRAAHGARAFTSTCCARICATPGGR